MIIVPLLAVSLSYIAISTEHAAARQSLQLQAKMLAAGLADKNDLSNAELVAYLQRASANTALKIACVLTPHGSTRASMQGPAYTDGTLPVTCDSVAAQSIGPAHLIVRVPIADPDLPRPVGEVALVAAKPGMLAAILRSALFSILCGLAITVVTWYLGTRLGRMLLTPIRQISTTAQRVSLYKDYSLRVVAGALAVVPKEIEALTESFNAMLDEIEDRDTRLTRKSEELEKSRKEAVVANQAKTQFLANVSHELRTPLNAIIGFSTMLQGEQFGRLGHKKYVEYSRDIHDAGKHLLDVINDILDLTKAENGTLSVTFEQLNLHKVLEKALNITAGQAHERKVDIYTDFPEKLPKIYGDRVRLVQIFLNLLNNAVKFSDEGGKVVVRARAEPAKGGIHYFTIEVIDQGIGMSASDIANAFQTFNQSDAGLNRKYDGAGLGLPLTKRLVELHHGKIKIESELGKGTTVTVRLTSDPALMD